MRPSTTSCRLSYPLDIAPCLLFTCYPISSFSGHWSASLWTVISTRHPLPFSPRQPSAAIVEYLQPSTAHRPKTRQNTPLNHHLLVHYFASSRKQAVDPRHCSSSRRLRRCSHSACEARKPPYSTLGHLHRSPGSSGRRSGAASPHRSTRDRKEWLEFHCQSGMQRSRHCYRLWPCLPSVDWQLYASLLYSSLQVSAHNVIGITCIRIAHSLGQYNQV